MTLCVAQLTCRISLYTYISIYMYYMDVRKRTGGISQVDISLFSFKKLLFKLRWMLDVTWRLGNPFHCEGGIKWERVWTPSPASPEHQLKPSPPVFPSSKSCPLHAVSYLWTVVRSLFLFSLHSFLFFLHAQTHVCSLQLCCCSARPPPLQPLLQQLSQMHLRTFWQVKLQVRGAWRKPLPSLPISGGPGKGWLRQPNSIRKRWKLLKYGNSFVKFKILNDFDFFYPQFEQEFQGNVDYILLEGHKRSAFPVKCPMSNYSKVSSLRPKVLWNGKGPD